MNLVDKMNQIFAHLFGTSESIIATVVTFMVFAVLYYYMIKFLFDNNSGVLVTLFVVAMVMGAAVLTFFEGLNSAIFLIVRRCHRVLLAGGAAP